MAYISQIIYVVLICFTIYLLNSYQYLSMFRFIEFEYLLIFYIASSLRIIAFNCYGLSHQSYSSCKHSLWTYPLAPRLEFVNKSVQNSQAVHPNDKMFVFELKFWIDFSKFFHIS